MSKWPLSELKGKIHIKHGFPFKSEFFSEEETNYVVLTPGNFHEEGGFKRQAGKEKFYTGEIPEDYLHKTGDLIVAMTEQAAGLLGSCARVPESDLYLHNQRLGLITTDSRQLLKSYVYHLFKTKTVRKQIRLTSTGSKVKHTSPERIYEVKAPLPDINEQQKIVNLLDAIESKIELNNRINAELEDMAKTIYDYWFLQFDFPDAYGKPYKTSGGEMVYNPTLKQQIPEGWDDGTLENLGQIVGGSTPSTDNPENFSMDDIPWITPNDLSKNRGNKFISRGSQDVSSEGVRAASLKKHPAGTVLLSSRAPIGYMAIARNKLTTNQGFKSFIPSKGYPTEFIYFAVKNSLKSILQYSSGSTFKEISSGVLKTVKISLPPDDIVEEYRKTALPLFTKQNQLELENEQLVGLRDWLLPMLMNGQVTIGLHAKKEAEVA